MKCSKCGKENKAGLPVCAYCGTAMSAANSFYRPGDLTSAQTEKVGPQPEPGAGSSIPASKTPAGFFQNPGDLSEKRKAEKTVAQHSQNKARGRTDSGKRQGKTAVSSKKKWLTAAACGLLVIAVAVLAIFHSGLILTKNGAQGLMDDAVNQTVQTMGESNILRDTLSAHLKITMLSLERKADGYQGVCSVRSVDCSDVLIAYFSGLSDDEVATGSEILARLESVVENAPVVEQEFVVTFIRTDSGYTPVFTEEMVNYCSGNMHLVQAYLIERMEQEGVQ